MTEHINFRTCIQYSCAVVLCCCLVCANFTTGFQNCIWDHVITAVTVAKPLSTSSIMTCQWNLFLKKANRTHTHILWAIVYVCYPVVTKWYHLLSWKFVLCDLSPKWQQTSTCTNGDLLPIVNSKKYINCFNISNTCFMIFTPAL